MQTALLLLLLAGLCATLEKAVPSPECAQYTVGDCRPDTVLETFRLDCSDGPEQCIAECQAACVDHFTCHGSRAKHCNWFTFSYELSECSLMREAGSGDFLSSCGTVSGGAPPTLLDCAGSAYETCSKFVPLNCSLPPGKPVQIQTGVSSAEDCQALVESFFFLGAAWFHYAAVPSGTCKLFSELEMIDCKGLAGPKDIPYDTCMTTTTTIITPTPTPTEAPLDPCVVACRDQPELSTVPVPGSSCCFHQFCICGFTSDHLDACQAGQSFCSNETNCVDTELCRSDAGCGCEPEPPTDCNGACAGGSPGEKLPHPSNNCCGPEFCICSGDGEGFPTECQEEGESFCSDSKQCVINCSPEQCCNF